VLLVGEAAPHQLEAQVHEVGIDDVGLAVVADVLDAPLEEGIPDELTRHAELARQADQLCHSVEADAPAAPVPTEGRRHLVLVQDALRALGVRRIVLARPAVEAGESLGFLPGDMQAKVDPYLRPLYDALEDMMPSEKVQKALETRIIEIAPLAYMRGRTLSDAFIILDEAQNATGAQMKMFLTRLGVNSRVVVTGDKTQVDLPKREDSGLIQVERILPGIEGISFCYLQDTDVVRHRLVRDIIRAYAEDQVG